MISGILIVIFFLVILMLWYVSGGVDDPGYRQYFSYLAKLPGIANANPVIKISDIPGELEYNPGFRGNFGINFSQPGVFLSEVAYLTELTQKFKPAFGEFLYVIYTGNSAGMHDWTLCRMFPMIKFIIIDPGMFDIKTYNVPHIILPNMQIFYLYSSYAENFEEATTPGAKSTSQNLKIFNTLYNKIKMPQITPEMLTQIVKKITDKSLLRARIFLIEDVFTNAMAEAFSVLNPHFISDIDLTHVIGEQPRDDVILYNMAKQYVWVNIIKPQSFMLNFQPTPGYKDSEVMEFMKPIFKQAKEFGIDFINKTPGGSMKYFAGDVHVNPWAVKNKITTRLINYNKLELIENIEYDIKLYESSMMYYNCVSRGLTHCENKYANRKLGFDCCQDCALESYIWQQYQSKCDPNLTVIDAVNGVNTQLRRNLLMYGHGKLFEPTPEFIWKRLESVGIEWTDIKFVTPEPVQIQEYRESNEEHLDKIYDLITPYFGDVNDMKNFKTQLIKIFSSKQIYKPIYYITDIEIPPGKYYPSQKYKSFVINYNLMHVATILQCYLESKCKIFVIPEFIKYSWDIRFIMKYFPELTILQFGAPNDISEEDFSEVPKTPGFYVYKSTCDLSKISGDYVYYAMVLADHMVSTNEICARNSRLYLAIKKFKIPFWCSDFRFHIIQLPWDHPMRPKNADDIIKQILDIPDVKAAISEGLRFDKKISNIPGAKKAFITPYTYFGSTFMVMFRTYESTTQTPPGSITSTDTSISGKLMYYLSLIRPYCCFDNPGAQSEIYFDKCADCTLFYKIISQVNDNPKQTIRGLLRDARANLNNGIHGVLFDPPGEKMLRRVYEIANPANYLFKEGGDEEYEN